MACETIVLFRQLHGICFGHSRRGRRFRFSLGNNRGEISFRCRRVNRLSRGRLCQRFRNSWLRHFFFRRCFTCGRLHDLLCGSRRNRRLRGCFRLTAIEHNQ